MYRPIQIRDPAAQQRFFFPAGLPALQPDRVARKSPQAQWVLADGHADVVARCSLWWDHTPPWPQHRLGLIGHYAARDAEAAAGILGLACERLAEQRCTLALGPIDGNTWQNYRLITERGDEPPFFLEPDHPDDYPAHFTGNGFTTRVAYYSALNDDLGQRDPQADDIAARLHTEGIVLRPLRFASLHDELRRIHALSLESFRGNVLFTPIAVEDFLAQYLPLQPFVNPELVLVAERRGTMVGYLFAVPDLRQAQLGQPIDTCVIKTLAVHPGLRGSGLGRLLVARCHVAAQRLNLRRAIHALMEETSRGRAISGHVARTIRRYAVFGRSLEG